MNQDFDLFARARAYERWQKRQRRCDLSLAVLLLALAVGLLAWAVFY